jgi:SAM-dependent methyltransferase
MRTAVVRKTEASTNARGGVRGSKMNAAIAPSYLGVTEQPGQPASRIQLEMLEARYGWAAAQARGKDVLEAGCGAGLGLAVLADVARSVEAGDVDRELLRAARAACAGHANIAIRAFRAQELPFPKESFDLVLLFEAIYYLPGARRFLEEARRVLRPGGTLLIVTVNPEWTGFNPSPLSTRYWSAGDLFKALREAGFAARVQAAFPETATWAAWATDVVRRAAVAMRLVPRTMRGKALLKRIFYGRLKAVPQLVGASVQPPALEELNELNELDARPVTPSRYRVLYVTASKVIA